MTRHVVDQGEEVIFLGRYEVWEHDVDTAIATFAKQADAHLFVAVPKLVLLLQNVALSLDDMARPNVLLKGDTWQSTCLFLSNEIRNVLASINVTAPEIES